MENDTNRFELGVVAEEEDTVVEFVEFVEAPRAGRFPLLVVLCDIQSQARAMASGMESRSK